MKGTYLGEFEEIVLLAVGILGDDAYGVTIRKEIETQSGRDVNIGAVHTAVHRLEAKGFLKSKFGESTDIRGGKRKRLFLLPAAGLKTFNGSRRVRRHILLQLPALLSITPI